MNTNKDETQIEKFSPKNGHSGKVKKNIVSTNEK